MKIAIKKVLCPVDFSENAGHALDYAIAFATVHHAELRIMHVMQLPWLAVPTDPMAPEFSAEVMNDYADSCKRQLDALVESVTDQYAHVTHELCSGAPFMEIIRVAREQSIDLIVIGTHGRTGLAHMMMGSVAEKVVRKAPCPVLSVKHPGHTFVMP